MNPQVMAVYLFILKVLNALGSSAQTLVDALSELGSAVASKDVGRIADAVAAFVKSLVPIVHQFDGSAGGHFEAHALMTPAALESRVASEEKNFHGIFGGTGGLLGGLGGGQLLKLLPTIISILQLFGVKVPTLPTLPTG